MHKVVHHNKPEEKKESCNFPEKMASVPDTQALFGKYLPTVTWITVFICVPSVEHHSGVMVPGKFI